MLGQINLNKVKRRMVTVALFAMVIISFLSNFNDVTSQTYFKKVYIVIGNFTGFSIVGNLIFLYFLSKLKYCIHTKLGVASLICFNVFNFLHGLGLINYVKYSLLYDTITLLAMFVILIVYYIYKYLKK